MANERTALIVSAGKEEKLDYIIPLAENADFIIAADGGYNVLNKLSIKADVVIGDFDSSNIIDNAIVLPTVKDDTDTLAAVKYAVKNGYKNIILTSASGGRLDHYLANLLILEFLDNQNINAILYNNDNKVVILKDGTYNFKKDENYKYFGLIPLDSVVKSVSITGSQYDINNLDLHRNNVISVSNEFKTHNIEISIKEGKMLLVFSKD